MTTSPSTRRRTLALAALLVAAATAFSGCTMFKSTPDTTRFYLLTAPPPKISTVRPPGSAANAVTLGIRRVDLPGYLRNRSLAFRPGGTEVRYAREIRWGEPLDQGIARVLQEGLSAEPRVKSVIVYPAPGVPEPQYEILVRVASCEGVMSPTGANAWFAAEWDIRSTGPDGMRVGGGRFDVPDGEWDGESFPALTAKLGEAVMKFAHEIAQGIPRERP